MGRPGPPIGVAASRFSQSVYEHTSLGLREFEAARLRIALDHHGIDEGFWTRMRLAYTDREIVELSMCLGSWIVFGRLNRVLGLETACVLPGHAG